VRAPHEQAVPKSRDAPSRGSRRGSTRGSSRISLEARVGSWVAAGDVNRAFDATVARLGTQIFSYVCARTEDEDDARDVYQMFLEDTWRGIPAFRGECSLRTWCYKLAHHAWLRFHRDQFRRRRQPLQTTELSKLAARVTSRMNTQARSLRQKMGRLKRALEPEELHLLMLRVDRQLDWEDIASVLSAEGPRVTSAALRKRYERVKGKLARIAEEEGLLDEDRAGRGERFRGATRASENP